MNYFGVTSEVKKPKSCMVLDLCQGMGQQEKFDLIRVMLDDEPGDDLVTFGDEIAREGHMRARK